MKRLLSTKRAIVAAAALGLVVLVVVLSGAFADPYKDLEYARATEGEFVLDVLVRGELRSEKSRSVILPYIRGRTQIVSLIEEGVRVEPGDEVARIDMADLQNQLEQRQQQLELEQGNLDNFLASKPNRIRSAESSLTTAQYDYELAKLRLELSEFESAQQQEQRRLAFENAKLRVDEATRNLKSTKNRLEVDERRQRTRIRQARQRLDEVETQMEFAILRAPIAGIIVHGETYDGPTAGNRKIRAGDSVHRGQVIVTIPDLSEMLVDTRIGEGDYRKVSLGQTVELRLDAIQGPVFTGSLEEIATIASFDAMANASYFTVRVRLDSVAAAMRPGMTASIRIITDKVEKALYIPNRAVFEADGRTIVFPRGDMPEPREVRLGSRNLDAVIVLEGLEPGEEVCLTDPREPENDSSAASPVPGGGPAPGGSKSGTQKQPQRRNPR